MADMKLKNSPLWPTLLSAFVVPGAGQVYNREIGKGLLLMGGFFGLIIWFSKVITAHLTGMLPGKPEQWVQDQVAFYGAVMALINQQASMFMTFQLLLLSLWIYGMVDAYLTAKNRPNQAVESTDSEN